MSQDHGAGAKRESQDHGAARARRMSQDEKIECVEPAPPDGIHIGLSPELWACARLTASNRLISRLSPARLLRILAKKKIGVVHKKATWGDEFENN